MSGPSTSVETSVPVFQKDDTCVIGKHERDPQSSGDNQATMARKGFTNDDVMVICTDIARMENILVLFDNKSDNSSHIKVVSDKKESSISQKLKSVKGALTKRNTSKLIENAKTNTEEVPGLQGRDIVAVAILVGEDGQPIKSYTENDEIPSDEMESAENVILTRVPVNSSKGSEEIVKENKDPNSKSAVEILNEELDANIRKKLIKRIEKILIRLHTTDLITARSFLKSDRYANVRKAIKAELISFITKDMKLVLAEKR